MNTADTSFGEIEGKVLKAKVKGHLLSYCIRIPALQDVQLDNMLLKLSYDTKREKDQQILHYPLTMVRKSKKHWVLESLVDLEQIPWKPLNWKFVLEISKVDCIIEIPLKNRSYLNYAKYCSLFFDNSYDFGDGMFVYPYVNGARDIALQYRERGQYDDWHIKMIERLAVVRLIFSYLVLRKMNIWLVFEKYSQMAQDNGYYFFKYCMENDVEEKYHCHIFYVIEADSPDRSNLLEYEDHVIDFMSIRHVTYALAAKLLISTDAKAHVYPWRRKGSALVPFIKRKPLVFLQHGVTAMKKVDFFYGKGKGGSCDMFIVTSEFEQQIVYDHFGYEKNRIPITGFARWDVLEDKSDNCRDILIMPTWRSWLEDFTSEEFRESEYFKRYYELLCNPKFYETLSEQNICVKFYLHPKFKDYIQEFLVESDRVQVIAFGQQPLNELMMKCRMLITDYSSVSWDMFYQKKPVLFYQFDREDYLEAHGSYLDMEKELFGYNSTDLDDLLVRLKEYAQNNFSLTDMQKQQYEMYFPYVDDKNSQRICEAIKREFL